MNSGKLEATTLKDIHGEIVEQCKAGSQSAQFMLYNLYKKAMFNVALRIVNDLDDAEDVLQESFISAFKNLNLFEGRSTFGAWLKRIVINKALSLVKGRKEQTQSLEGGIEYWIWSVKGGETQWNLPDRYGVWVRDERDCIH